MSDAAGQSAEAAPSAAPYPPPAYPTGQSPAPQPPAGPAYPGQVYPGQASPGQPATGQAYPGQAYPGQAYPGQSYPGQPAAGQPYPGQAYPGQSYPGQAYPGYPQGAYGYTPPSPPVSTNAVVGLVLAIVSWLVCPVIPAIVALVLAGKAEREINAAPDRVSGRSLLLPIRIISWLNIGLVGSLIVIGAVFVVILSLLGQA